MESLERSGLNLEITHAGDGSASTFFKHAMEYVWHPGRYFKALQRRPSWFHMYLASAFCACMLSYLNFPFLREIFAVTLLAQAPADQVGPALATFERGRWLGLLLAPLLLLIKLALQAVLLAIIAATATSRATFRSAFAVITNLQPFMVLQGAFTLCLLYYAGVGEIRTAADMQRPIGLDLFAGSSVGLPILTVLHAVNLFDVLWLSYLYVALRRMFDCQKGSATLIVGIYWVITVGFNVALAVLSLDSRAVGT
jgi:hypothetical protein